LKEILIETEYIRIDQLLKFSNIVGSGGEAKILIKEGLVKVNGEIVTQRGKKIRNDDVVEFEDIKFKVINKL
jgi:ribosome-associated protein